MNISMRCGFVNRLFAPRNFRGLQCKMSTSLEAVQIKSPSPDKMGQPTSKSHPHLVKPGEVVSGIRLSEVVQRRDNLVKEIVNSKSPGSCHLVIIPSSTVFYMSEDVPYLFRQDTDFRYLTGCLEPDTALMILISADQSYKTVFFSRETNKHTDLWEGPRTGSDVAPEYFGVDEAFPLVDMKSILSSKIKSLDSPFNLWYDFQSSCLLSVSECLSTVIPDSGCEEVMNPEGLIHKLRIIKSKAEQHLMAESCRIMSECMITSMKRIKHLKSEHEVFATLDYETRMKGSEMLAYPPVVACGTNANIIHYIKNNQAFTRTELLLVDAGAEHHGYCSDITRTWPTSGVYSDIQRTLYDVVLRVQEESLIHLKNQRPSLDGLLEFMSNALHQRLGEAHVLTKLAENQNQRAIAHKFCPHHVGHYLGMDVHDTATIARKIPLAEGMIVTVEPGAYIRESNDFAKPEFRGIGMRIEDDVLITSNGINVLSSPCPKSPEEIEKLCKA